MGLTPTFPDYEEGAICATCVDLLFGGISPKYIEAHVDGIQKCFGAIGDPPDGVYLLKQQPAPCHWIGRPARFILAWQLLANRSDFGIIEFVGGQFRNWFVQAVPVVCAASFVNTLVCTPWVDYGFDGTVTLYWGPGVGP